MTSLQKAAPYTNVQVSSNEEGRAEARLYKIEMRREMALREPTPQGLNPALQQLTRVTQRGEGRGHRSGRDACEGGR